MKLKDRIINRDDGFIVQILFVLFYILERVSLFYWIKKWFGKKKNGSKIPIVKSYIFPEMWAVGNLLFAICVLFILNYNINKVIICILFVYAVLRVLELLVYQVNVLFFHRMNRIFLKEWDNGLPGKNKDEYMIKSSVRTVILLILNVFEYIIQFAVMYKASALILGESVAPVGILESFDLFMNINDLTIYKGNTWFILAVLETLIGIFMNILCLAVFIGMLPKASERGYEEEKENTN